METIHKFVLPDFRVGEPFDIEIPQGSTFLDAQWQVGNFVVWYKVETRMSKDMRTFVMIFTGHEITIRGLEHRATIQASDGFVFHLFEVTNRTEWKS